LNELEKHFGELCKWMKIIPMFHSKVLLFFETLTTFNHEMNSLKQSHDTVMTSFKQHMTNISQLENHFHLKLEQIQSGSMNEHDLCILLGDISKQKNDLTSLFSSSPTSSSLSSTSMSSSPISSISLNESSEMKHDHLFTLLKTLKLQWDELITVVDQEESKINELIDVASKIIENQLPTLRCSFKKVMLSNGLDEKWKDKRIDSIQKDVEGKLNEWKQLRFDTMKTKKCMEWLEWVENQIVELKKKRHQTKEEIEKQKTKIITIMNECQRQIIFKMNIGGVCVLYFLNFLNLLFF
jgi:hypothetical protein